MNSTLSRYPFIIGLIFAATIASASAQKSYVAELCQGMAVSAPAIIPTPDGGAIVGVTLDAGAIVSCFVRSDNKLGAVRIDSSGQVLWTHSYGLGTTCALVSASDTSLVLLGTWPGGKGEKLIKLAMDGSVIWSRNLVDTAGLSFFHNSAVGTRDGGVLLLGSLVQSVDQGRKALLTKVNREGDVEWSLQTGRPYQNEAESAVQMENGRFIVSGFFGFENACDGHVPVLLEVSESGKILSVHSVEGSAQFPTTKLIRNSENEHLLLETMDKTGNTRSTLLTLLGKDLRPQWSKEIKGDLEIQLVDAVFQGENPVVLITWYVPDVHDSSATEEIDKIGEWSNTISISSTSAIRNGLLLLQPNGNLAAGRYLLSDRGQNLYESLGPLASGSILTVAQRQSDRMVYRLIAKQEMFREDDGRDLSTLNNVVLRDSPLPTLSSLTWISQRADIQSIPDPSGP